MALEAEVPQSVVDRFTVELPHMVKQQYSLASLHWLTTWLTLTLS